MTTAITKSRSFKPNVEIATDEVLNALTSFRTKISPGPDNVYPKGTAFAGWKEAAFTPIFFKEMQQECELQLHWAKPDSYTYVQVRC